MLWASFAVAPLKRFIIEFPFVAEKAIPTALKAHIGHQMPCIRNIVYRRCCVRINAVIACLSWPFPEVLGQWLNNCFRG
jgi:hypothetical protein